MCLIQNTQRTCVHLKTDRIHVPHHKLKSGAGTVPWDEDRVVTSHRRELKANLEKINKITSCWWEKKTNHKVLDLMVNPIKNLWSPSFPGLGHFCFALGSHKNKIWPSYETVCVFVWLISKTIHYPASFSQRKNKIVRLRWLL